MSAIWGQVLYKNDKPTASMKYYYDTHCKIDQINETHEGNVMFACGIQYITREAREEKLPLYDANRKIYFTADCILDNREELIEQLGLHYEKNKVIPDGEVMFHTFLKWGTDSFRRFRGLFSVAVYDTQKQELILTTDQTANRCLYYYCDTSGVTFSTLLMPIIEVYGDITYNEMFLKDFLVAPGLCPNIVPTDTPYQGVYKINPGTYLSIINGNVEEHTYWTPGMYEKDYHCHNARQYGKAFMSIMKTAVHDALRTEGEVGIAQSSGLDSLTVGTLAATELAGKKKSLYTYTYIPSADVSDKTGKDYVINEKEAVELVAKQYPNMITHFLDNEGRDCYCEIPKILDVLEIPYKSLPNSPSLYEIYEKAGADGCKVVLSGQYGNVTISHGNIDDILFDLYNRKKYITMLKYMNRYCKTVGESRKKALFGCCRYYRSVKRKYKKPMKYSFDLSYRFLQENILSQYPVEERFNKGKFTTFEKLPITEKGYREILFLKSVLVYIGEIETKMGLKHGVVLRDPTRDVNIMEFCHHLPHQYFAYQGIPRWLVRGNMRQYIPYEILGKWLRYGVQNSDWLYRLKNNQERLYRDILGDLDVLSHIITVRNQQIIPVEWVNITEIQEFLSLEKDMVTWENYIDWIALMVVCVFSKYIKK